MGLGMLLLAAVALWALIRFRAVLGPLLGGDNWGCATFWAALACLFLLFAYWRELVVAALLIGSAVVLWRSRGAWPS